jgi:predicted transcriptional regulator
LEKYYPNKIRRKSKKMGKIIKDGNYIHIESFMVTQLKLKGNELIVYAIIYGFSQDGKSKFIGSLDYLAEWTNSTPQGIIKNLKSLVEKGLIIKQKIKGYNAYFCVNIESAIKQSLNNETTEIQQSLISNSTKFNPELNKVESAIKQSLNNTIINNNNTKGILSAVGGDTKKSFPKEYYNSIYDAYFENCKRLYSEGRLSIEKPDVTYKAVNQRVKQAFENFGFEKVLLAVKESINHKWLVDNGYQISYLFGATEITTLINRAYPEAKKSETTEERHFYEICTKCGQNTMEWSNKKQRYVCYACGCELTFEEVDYARHPEQLSN